MRKKHQNYIRPLIFLLPKWLISTLVDLDRRQKDLREFLIRAKTPNPPNQRPIRVVKGMVKCGQQCSACPYIKEGKTIRFGKSTWNINKRFSCKNYHIIYLIECNKDKCRQCYIGESKIPLRNRFADHLGYVVNHHIDTATGGHFPLPGHSVSNMTVTIPEQAKINNDSYRKECEKYLTDPV